MPTYGGHCVMQGFEGLQLDVQARVAELRARGDTADANRVLDAYVALRDELAALGVRMAARGTEILREHERLTRVRPIGAEDLGTEGGGGPRLEDALFCEPIVSFGIHGAIGIANEDILNSQVPWWWTQERGYGGNVGRVIFGAFFHPGDPVRPSADEDKEHALFQPRGRELKPRGSMMVRKPIAARRFLRSGAAEIEAQWLTGFDAAQATFIAEVITIP